MLLGDAEYLAEQLLREIEPFCERVEIAGSIRRKKPEVKDIELVCAPCWEEEADPADLFGERKVRVNTLFRDWAAGERAIRWIKTGTDEIVDWHVKPEGKYWRGLLPSGVKLDLFLTEPGNFGLQYVIRTGSWEFSRALVTHARDIGKPARDGWLWNAAGERIVTPTEAHVFAVLGLEWVWPEQRTADSAVRPLLAAADLAGSPR
jgi:DNA polymerase/3'-5' exonuclease PolX